MTARYVYAFRTTRHRVAENPGTIQRPSDVLPVVKAALDGRETEALVVVLLNAKNAVIGLEVVYEGNVSASMVRVAEVFRGAVRMNAAGLVVAHNHPSGDPTPSPDDLHLTAECIAAGKLLDIDVLDHVIVADDGFVSLRDRGVTFDQRQGRLQ